VSAVEVKLVPVGTETLPPSEQICGAASHASNMYGMRSLRKRPTSSPSGVLISSPTTIRNFRSPGTGSFPTNTSRTRSTVAKSQAKGDSPPRPGPAAVIAALKKPPASKLGAPMKPTEKPSPSRASLRRCRCCCSIARDHEEDRVRETASSRCLHRDGPRIRCALGPLERGLGGPCQQFAESSPRLFTVAWCLLPLLISGHSTQIGSRESELDFGHGGSVLDFPRGSELA
jgi:hypothetical protein